jgi:hypothetical protein
MVFKMIGVFFDQLEAVRAGTSDGLGRLRRRGRVSGRKGSAHGGLSGAAQA